jgi:transposase
MPIDGATAAEGCRVCGEPVRRPPWRPGDMVIMDHLRAHHATGIQKAMEQAGAGLWSVPPYSPDVSPIERGWSTLKTAWRKAQARTREACDHAIAQALATITRSNARSWCHHGGDTFTSASRTALGEHKVAVPVYEDPQVHESLLDRDGGDICTPHLVGRVSITAHECLAEVPT